LALEHQGRVTALVGLHRAGTVTELFSLAVDPDHQGRGLGRRLVTEALWLEPAETYQLEVDSSNLRAETLYRSLGFEDLEVTDYYLVEAR
jgi:ribosomal-protein-alanine N-acetyltransferase